MNNVNEKKLAYLINELGMIDDRYVDEALRAYQIRPVKKGRLAIMIAAIAVGTVMLITASLGIMARIYSSFDKLNDAVEEAPTEITDRLGQTLLSLEAEKLSTAVLDAPIDQVIYDGNTRFIWTYDGLVYYSVTVRDSMALRDLEAYLETDRSQSVDENDALSDLRFWISYGNGISVSPYLENNQGRISVGTLSDYSPEIYPSEQFASFIGRLIENQL